MRNNHRLFGIVAALCLFYGCDEYAGEVPQRPLAGSSQDMGADDLRHIEIHISPLGQSCEFNAVQLSALNEDKKIVQNQNALYLSVDEHCVAKGDFFASLFGEASLIEASVPATPTRAPQTLRAIYQFVDEGPQKTSIIYVTPFSELAVAWSEAQGDNLAQAQHNLEAFLGTKLQPDISSPLDLERLSKAFATLAARIVEPHILEHSELSLHASLSVIEQLKLDGADGSVDGRHQNKRLKVAGELLSAALLRDGMSDTLLVMSRQSDDAAESDALHHLAARIAQSQSTLIERSRALFEPAQPVLWACRVISSKKEHVALAQLQPRGAQLMCQLNFGEPTTIRSLKLQADTCDLSSALKNCQQNANRIACDIEDLAAIDVDEAKVVLKAQGASLGNSSLGTEIELNHPRPTLSEDYALVATQRTEGLEAWEFESSEKIAAAYIVEGSLSEQKNYKPVAFSLISEPSARAFRYRIDIPLSQQSGFQKDRLILEDTSGWMLERPLYRVQHASPPRIMPLEGIFTGDFKENKEFNVHIFAWDAPLVVLNKLTYRLDYAPDRNATAETNNLPVLQFQAASTVAGNTIEGPHTALRIEYRLSEAPGLSNEMPWRSVEKSGDDRFALPLAYQTLLAPDDLAQSLDVIRARNHVARARPRERFTIEVRATDVAGNFSTQVFRFALNLRGEALVAYECKPTLVSRSVSYKELWNSINAQSPIFSGSLRARQKTHPDSLSPKPSYRVVVGGAQPASLDSRRARRLLVSTNEPLAQIQSLSAYQEEIKRKDPFVGQRHPAVNTPIAVLKDFYKTWHCYGKSECLSSVEDENAANLVQSNHLDGIPLLDVEVDAIGDAQAQSFSLMLNRPAATRRFPIELRSVPGLDEPELLLSRKIGQRFVELKAEGRVEQVETSQLVSLQLPNLRFDVVSNEQGYPPPESVERDAKCSENENDRIVLEFESPNRLSN